MKKSFIFLAGAMLVILFMSSTGEENGLQQMPITDSVTQNISPTLIEGHFGRIPLYFIANRGNMDKRVAYYVQGKNKTLYFTSEGITFALVAPSEKKGNRVALDREALEAQALEETTNNEDGAVGRWVVKLDFLGADRDVRPVGEKESGAVISYFNGRAEEWDTGLPTYSRILYRDLWPGIDLAFYGTVNKLKYEFVIHPGADPSIIRLAYRGAENVSVDENGRLQVTTPVGGFSDDVPVAYQEIGGERREVSVAYKFNNSSTAIRHGEYLDGEPAIEEPVYSFEIADYDHSQPIVVDPAILVYCGFIGGSNTESGNAIAVDGSGNAYVTGDVYSTHATFPVTVGPDLTHNGDQDVFVAKVNSSGTALEYCGYIGGLPNESCQGIAVDGSGNAYVAGYTYSTEATFPVTIGPDLTHNGSRDVFVAKINASGTALDYCGYIGGSNIDYAYGIAVDGLGNAYITGNTGSAEATFPVTVGPDLTHNYGDDAFVAKVNASGSALDYCGYIGGTGSDYGYGIAVDRSGNACVTGSTNSTEATFPAAVGPDLTHNGGDDAFVAKVNAAGTSLSYCGYIGGSSDEAGNSIAVDRLGNAYVTGRAGSTEATFPAAVGPDLTHNGGDDAFVAKVNAAGTSLAYCGYIGGSLVDYGNSIAVDGLGYAYIAGNTYSTEATFPVTVGPDLTHNGGLDVFVARVHSSGTALDYCGYIGGSGPDFGNSIAADGFGNAYVTGQAGSAFPVLVGPDLTHNGSYDAYVAKVYHFEQPVHKHAVGDFDGDGSDEVALDFGTSGAWLWNGSGWSQLTANNPENMIPFDSDGSGGDELAVDLGSLGLWMWNGGAWSQLSVNNPEYLIAADTNDNGIEELVIDFGTIGLWWRQEDGSINGITGVDPQNIITVDVDGDGNDEIMADFGTSGMWVWEALGPTWDQLTAADLNTMAGVDAGGSGNEGVATGFHSLGIWLWEGGAWNPLSGVDSDRVMSGKMIVGGGEEIVADFGLMGLWLWSSSAWDQLSSVNVEDMLAPDVDGNGVDEVLGDFGLFGLWLWNSSTWTQLSGANPEGLLAGDFDNDGSDELMIDFGSLGLWLWNGGAWSQISANNPD